MNDLKTILIVEDDDNHYVLMERAFEDYTDQFYVIRADRLASAVEIIINQSIDLILLDLKLPDGFGLDLFKRDDLHIDKPFIMMTGYGSQELVVEVLKSGAIDYIVKSPQSFTDMPRIVERAFREWDLILKSKKAEADLIESEAKYRTLIEHLPVGVYRIDIEGRILHANKSFVEILELPEDTNLNKINIDDFFYDGCIYDRIISKLEKEDKAVALEEKMITAADRMIWVKNTYNLIKPDDKLQYIDGIIENITTQKHTEQALTNSELKYRRVFETLIDVYFEMRIDGEIIEVSPSISSISGKERNDFLGKTIADLFFNREDANNFIDLLLQKGKIPDYEAKLIIKNEDEPIDCSISAIVVTDDYSGFLKITGLIRNISERKNSDVYQTTLFQIANAANISSSSGELFQRIGELLTGIIRTNSIYIALISNSDDRITYPYSKNIDTYNQDINAVYSLTEYVLKTGNPILWDSSLINKKIANKDILRFIYPPKDILAVPLKNPSRNIGVICMLNFQSKICFTENDLSIILFASNQIALSIERKLKEEQYRTLNAELEQKVKERTNELNNAYNELKTENIKRKEAAYSLEKAKMELEIALQNEKELSDIKSRFITMISHEYRTPLTVVLSSTELIRLSIQQQKYFNVDKYLEKIENSVNNMNLLLNKVLHIDSEEDMNVNLNYSVLDLKKFSDDIIEELYCADKFDNEIVKSYNNKDIIVISDPNLLKHVITNILSNAIKYSPEKSEIEYKINTDTTRIILSISDQGIGIPDDELKNIFEPFYRCKNVGSIAGTGLGLSIVKRFVNLLKGEIKVKSYLNAGSTFQIEIPIQPIEIE